jgi:hypothetical protein
VLFNYVQSIDQKGSSRKIIGVFFQGKTYGFDKASHELVKFVFLEDNFGNVTADLLNQVVERINVIDLLEFLVQFMHRSYCSGFEKIRFLLNEKFQVVANFLHLLSVI